MKFNRVVIWGYTPNSHTHAYAHEAYYRAFKEMGYDTYWLEDHPVDNSIFKNSLFITEGQVDKNIPIRSDCTYVLHNCSANKYTGRSISLQVYASDLPSDIEKIGDCAYFSPSVKCLYQPWATNLLPREIDFDSVNIKRERVINYVGTIADTGLGTNAPDVIGFSDECAKVGIPFNIYGGYPSLASHPNIAIHHGLIDNDKHVDLIHRSYLAPQFCNVYQKEKKHITCRIFKNISYGQYGITNSYAAYEFFDGKIIYADNGKDLFEESERKKGSQDLLGLMKLVRDKHTYINRAKSILKALESL